MRVRSIAWRTDLELRRLEGAQLTDHEDHLVVRIPANPSYRWGNFLLLASAQPAADVSTWIARFEAAFPGADHVAIGLDSPANDPGATSGFAKLGMNRQVSSVLVANALRSHASRPPGTKFRRVESDDDWRRATGLRLLADEAGEGAGYRDFLERRMGALRRVCERGHGAWFGAFRDGEMLSGLGIFAAGDGLARFQLVDTHPEHRREGLASNLLVTAGEYACVRLRASTLVIVADPDYIAVSLYRSLGFAECEQQVQFERVGR